jgi:hypothetical protein
LNHAILIDLPDWRLSIIAAVDENEAGCSSNDDPNTSCLHWSSGRIPGATGGPAYSLQVVH